MAFLPLFPSVEFSLVLGTFIAERLPTVQARAWRKALMAWEEYGGISLIKKRSLKNVPRADWPLEAVLFCYPGKKVYGEGELIMLELKLMGESADHALFLETILPALETASSTIDGCWQAPYSIWGRFDIKSIYVARGPKWEPLVDDGRLDLRYKATPLQWSEGLCFHSDSQRLLRNLTWVTPFDLRPNETDGNNEENRLKITPGEVPSLKEILTSFMLRMNSFSTGKRNKGIQFWDLLSSRDRNSFQEALEQSSDIPMIHGAFQSVPRRWPGRWIGSQKFSIIPDSIVPYLGLASIFHIGEHTHFGCGTFVLD
ncbi:MAG: hypothetical protein J7M32_10640 [Deltaproteobacteria bacterium]|nr:hypothetical protein [Deltaproteobacteria bacterium]